MEQKNIEQIKQEVEPISNQADGLVVSNPTEYKSAADYLLKVKSALKNVNEKIIAPAEEVKRVAEASRKNLVNLFRVPLERAEAMLKGRMLIFDADEREKAEQERRRLQKIVDDKAEAEKQRQVTAANKLKTESLREERLAEAEEVEAPVVHVQTETPKVAGISTRTAWKAKIVNKKDFIEAATKDPNLLGFITINQTSLDRLAQATKGELKYPGIEFYSSQVMAAGGTK